MCMTDPNDMFVQATEGGSIGTADVRLCKMVTVSGEDMWLGIWLCIGALCCCC